MILLKQTILGILMVIAYIGRYALIAAVIMLIAYIPLRKELKKRDQRILELEERIEKLEQDRQER